MITTVTKDGTILTPAVGKWLVKGDAYTDGVVYLGKSDSPSNWVEQATKPPDPPEPMDAEAELPLVKAELGRYKQAVAEVTALNTSTALKTTLVDAVNRLKVAVAEPIKETPVVPIGKVTL